MPHFSASEVDRFLDYLLSVSHLVPGTTRRRPILRDADDDRILEVAIESEAAIVTHNLRDFSGSEQFGVQVITPKALLKALETKR